MFQTLFFLFEHFKSQENFPSPEDINQKLLEAGFWEEDISKTLHFFESLFNEISNLNTPDEEYFGSRFRIFSHEEINKLPKEVRGCMHFLYQQEGMNPYKIEFIINALMKLPRKDVNLKTAKLITLIVAWITQSELPILIGDELLSVLYEKAICH